MPDIIAAINESETRVRADIKEVRSDLKKLDTRVDTIEKQRDHAEGRAEAWGSMRTLIGGAIGGVFAAAATLATLGFIGV